MWGQKLGRFIDHLLYRSYYQGNAVGDFIRQRVNPGAWLLLLGGGTSVFLGANLDESLTAILTLFILSLLFSSFVWAFLRRAKLSVVRVSPFGGAVGEIGGNCNAKAYISSEQIRGLVSATTQRSRSAQR